MKKFYFTLLVASCPFTIRAWNDNILPGSRFSAMGHASVSLSDPWSVGHNQAGLAFLKDISTTIHYENRFLMKELGVKSAAVIYPVKGGTFGLNMTSFGYSLYSENKYGLAFAKTFGDQLSAGVAIDYLNTRIAEGYGNKNTFVAELGIQAKPTKELTIGAHLFNPTRSILTDFNTERIPTIIRIGADYNFSNKATLAIETEKDISQRAIFKAGLEYKATKEFYLRAGISTAPTMSAFGLGLIFKNFKADLSANYHQSLGISPQISLLYTFSKKEAQ